MKKTPGFKNIEDKTKAVAKALPPKETGYDSDSLYGDISYLVENGTLDTSSLERLTSISMSRDTLYLKLEEMASDSLISAILRMLATDSTETNVDGDIIWAQSSDANIQRYVNYLLKYAEADKSAYPIAYNLAKYGDVYLRLYRESDTAKERSKDDKKSLNESMILKTFEKNDKFTGTVEVYKDPAEMFELSEFGKTVGYLQTHIYTTSKNSDSVIYDSLNNATYQYDRDDVYLFPATEFVHAYLHDTNNRARETITITNSGEEEDIKEYTYDVKRGLSMLFNAYKTWRIWTLLENAVVLNRLTKSSTVKIVAVEVGDMEGPKVKNMLRRVKMQFEQKSAISVGTSMEDYASAGPVENIIYIPVHDSKGGLSVSDVGGEQKDDAMNDVNYWKTKLLGYWSLPKQFLSDTEDSGGFNGGETLSILSSQWAKFIKMMQEPIIRMWEYFVNIILIDRGLENYIGKFTICMKAPLTKYEQDAKAAIKDDLDMYSSLMGSYEGLIEDNLVKLKMLNALMKQSINNAEFMQLVTEYAAGLEKNATQEQAPEEGGEDMLSDLGGDMSADYGGGQDFDLSSTEDFGEPESGAAPGESEPLTPDSETGSPAGTAGGEKLPSFNDLGVDGMSLK